MCVTRRVGVTVTIAAALLVVGPRVTTQTPQTPSYGVTLMRDIMVPMRDGVKLATDIYLPAVDGKALPGKLPVILERTPYNKDRGGAANAKAFVPYGYAVVSQDTRGRYKSEGKWRALADDPNDGADTTKWIGAQPWSSGSIGTIGTSYVGGTQHALAIGDAPFVKTMIPVDAMTNIGRYGVRHNGAFELRFFNFTFSIANATGRGGGQRGLGGGPCCSSS